PLLAEIKEEREHRGRGRRRERRGKEKAEKKEARPHPAPPPRPERQERQERHQRHERHERHERQERKAHPGPAPSLPPTPTPPPTQPPTPPQSPPPPAHPHPPPAASVADIAVSLLRSLNDPRPVHARQLAAMAMKRKLLAGDPEDLWRTVRAALIADARERHAAGMRPRARAQSGGLLALAPRQLDDPARGAHEA